MKTKILFVCTLNIQRSKTAEELYKDDPRFEVRSAGVSDQAAQPITSELVVWADQIFVMERWHKQVIEDKFPGAEEKIKVLHIPDSYYYMNPELVAWIRQRIESFFKSKN